MVEESKTYIFIWEGITRYVILVIARSNSVHLETLLSTIRSMSVSLDVWKSADNKKKYEWTPLMGGKKRKLLKELPDEFDKVLPKDKAPAVQQL